MKQYFQKLYGYNQWANRSLLAHLTDQDFDAADNALKLSHVIAAEEIWFHRIKPLGFELLPLFEAQTWDLLAPRLERSAQRWLGLIDEAEDFQEIISYQTTSGTPYQTPLDDILIHVANHGTYHRGQIATAMRKHGQEPLVTDYIAFCRN